MLEVDIIILSWDRTRDTIEAIDSALAQQGVGVNVIVFDQGSNPENLKQISEHCARFPNVNLIENGTNVGIPAGRNRAAQAGHSKYVIALDNDAEFMDPRLSAKAMKIMEARDSLAALGFRIDLFSSHPENPQPDRSSWGYAPLDPADHQNQIFPALAFVGAGFILRRTAFEDVGMFDEKLFFMHEEQDLTLRLINAGHDVEYRGDLAVGHKVSSERRVDWKSDRYRLHLRNRIYILTKHKGAGWMSFEELLVMLVAGFRLGLILPTVRGVLGALAFVPAARRHRKLRPDLYGFGDRFLRYVAAAPHDGMFNQAPQIWDDKNIFYRLYCRLRWQTNYRAGIVAPDEPTR